MHTDTDVRRLRTGTRALVALCSIALLFFGLGAAPSAAQSAEDDPEMFDAGEAIYQGGCAGCHGENGEGSDTGRPLTGIASQEPDRLVHIASVTDGKGGMPALGTNLSPEDIDAAVSYVRLAFLQEDEMEELPRTGTSDWVFGFGIALLVLGAIAVRYEHRGSLSS